MLTVRWEAETIIWITETRFTSDLYLPCNPGVNEPVVQTRPPLDSMEDLRSEAYFLHDTWPERINQHIRACDEPSGHGYPCRILKIEDYGPFTSAEDI